MPETKKPHDAERPYPWRCHTCGQVAVRPQVTAFSIECKYEGKLYFVELPAVEMPICGLCGERYVTNTVDEKIQEALLKKVEDNSPPKTRTIINRHGYLYDAVTGRRYDRASPTNWVDPTTSEPAPDPFKDDPDNNH